MCTAEMFELARVLCNLSTDGIIKAIKSRLCCNVKEESNMKVATTSLASRSKVADTKPLNR